MTCDPRPPCLPSGKALMSKMTSRSASPLLALLLAACSSVPQVDVTYYLPKATVTLKLNQTLQCTKSTPPQLIAAYVVTPAISYTRDPRREKHIALQDLDGV